MTTTGYPEREERKRTAKVAAVGSVTEAVCGAAAVALAIIALVGVLPGLLASIAVIVLGVALLSQGGAIAANYNELMRPTEQDPSADMAEFGGGISTEFIGGVAGIVLGVLSLIGIIPQILLPVSVITLGAVTVMGAGVLAGLNRARIDVTYYSNTMQRAARQAVDTAAGMEVMVGIGAIVVGILALIGIMPTVLTLVGILTLGAGLLIAGSAVGARMVTAFRR